jgi:hypothetical protein
VVSEVIQLYRDAAWQQLIQQETELIVKNQKAERERFNVLGGKREIGFNPFR